MGKFKSTKRVSLAFAGDGWSEAYMVVLLPNVAEARTVAAAKAPETLEEADELSGKVMKLLQDHFVSGKAPVDGQLEDLTAADVPELPLNVIAELRDQVVGSKALDPNS